MNMRKLLSKIKYYSFLVMPLMVFIVLFLMNRKLKIISLIPYEKIAVLVTIVAALIGALLTVLTIFLSFPKNDTVSRRLKTSGHFNILISNIFAGLVFFILSLLTWLLFNNNDAVIYLFCCGITNMTITGYYIMALSSFT